MTALAVSKLKDDGRYAVGGVDGLHLRIAGGSRAWILWLMVPVNDHDGVHDPSSRRAESGWTASGCSAGRGEGACRRIATKGKGSIDPVAEQRRVKALQARRGEQAKTFADCAKAYLVSHRASWKNAKHGQ